jgi:two-component system cell cycle response regulator DivK
MTDKDKNSKTDDAKDTEDEKNVLSSRSTLRQAMEARRSKSSGKPRVGESESEQTVMASRSALERAKAERLARERKKKEGGGLSLRPKIGLPKKDEEDDDEDSTANMPRPGSGAEADATVALNTGAGTTSPPPSKPAASGEGSGKKDVNIDPAEAHVLVVEDNVPNFVLIARLLAYMGIQRCEWKTSGWQVVEFADTLPRIDLILMDIRLPYEDGYQALQRVRSNPRLKDTLVIAVTAEADQEQLEKAQKAGFDGFLAKPLDPDRFPEQIKRVLRGEPVWELN